MTLAQIKDELKKLQFSYCKWDWAEEAYPITPAGVTVLPILSKDFDFPGYRSPKYLTYSRLGIECSISGDPDNPGGVLVILADMLASGKRLLVPFNKVEEAEKELPRLVYSFILL